ncbi:MAG: histidinol-phosphate transaminase [Rhizobiales bacterium]|nr:histidinol-phosphate transaminase [Hyphomicrobiales bacterium]OJY04751.1 MAG: histidinol-phosphate transaminase [Rhizobiales bacterium 63-22]
MSDGRRHIRDEVMGIPSYNSGLTLKEVRERYHPAVIAKLGSNENPLGASGDVIASQKDLRDLFRLYPDPKGRDLCEAIANRFGVDASGIILGNGSEDLIAVVCKAVVRPGDMVTTLYPSFPLHEDYAVLMGGKVERIEILPDFSIDTAALIAAAKRKPRMIMFANPMNPVGTWIGQRDFERFLDAVDIDTLLVVDEAYAEYARGEDYPATLDLLRAGNKSWMLLRTFSKAYGLAGLRIGFGIISSPELVDFLNRVRTPFNTNAIAQAAAIAALQDEKHISRTVTLAVSERARVTAALRQWGIKVAPSKGNFVFFDCGEDAAAFAETLLMAGVIVKPWRQAGYTTFIRASIGSIAENDQFLNVLSVNLPKV